MFDQTCEDCLKLYGPDGRQILARCTTCQIAWPTPPAPPPLRTISGGSRVWPIVALVALFSALSFVAGRAGAYDLERCEWLGNQSFQLAHMRDAGVSLGQVKSMVRNSDLREEVKVGVKALARYVYWRPNETPDEISARLESECRGYDE